MTGRPFTYEPADDSWWEHRWRARGKEEWAIEAGLTSFAAIRAGELDVVSDDHRQLTGSDPLTIEQIVTRDMT